MNDISEKTLIEALDLLEQGLAVDEILARYPGEAADLRPFLQTAAALATLATQPTVAAQSRSRADFLAAAEMMAAAPSRRTPSFGRLARRMVMPLLAVVVAVFMGTTLLAGAAGTAVPGSALYATKRRIEEARVSLATDPERAAALRESFRQERIHEIESLFATGSAAQVELSGAIEAMDGDRWQVSGLPVALAGGTIVDGAPSIGAVVRVEGQTNAGVVIADLITVLSAAPSPTAEPTLGVTPAAGGEESPENTPAGRPAGTQNPTPMATPSATPSPLPELTITPGPSATPDDSTDNTDDDAEVDDHPDDNTNDNDHGNSDGSGDEDPSDSESTIENNHDSDADTGDDIPSGDIDDDGINDA